MEELEPTLSKKERARELTKEAIEKAQENLEQFLSLIEKTNQEMVKREKLPVISQTEARDLQMDVDKPGWFKYWKERLASEIDILPESIQQIVIKLNKREDITKKGHPIFSKYINKRIIISKFNIEKRMEMGKLRQRLQDIDKQEDYPEKEAKARRTIFCRGPEDELFVQEKGKEKKITFGDIVADYDWGIKYRPDKSVPDKVWRKIRKLSDFTDAKAKINEIFNREISRMEKIALPTTGLPIEFLEKNFNKEGIEGIIAERMARNFLARLQYSNPEIGLTVESSNAIEDAELKYDFKIMTSQKRRGVAVEGDEVPRKKFVAAKKRIGIQFTATMNPSAIRKKEFQIKWIRKNLEELESKYQHILKDPVDDIVLVALPLGTYKDCYKKWLDTGKPSGGPEQYLGQKDKTVLLKRTTRDFLDLSENEIEELKF